MTVRMCVSCGSELPSGRRSDRRYCGGRCRVRAHRIRKGEGQHVRPTRKHGHTALKVALGTAAAATAAAVAVEVVRKSQAARLAEHERKIADLEAQLRKSQTEKEELRREMKDLRNRVEQVTREKKEKEEQICQTRKALDAEKETVKTLRSSLESARQEREQAELRLLVETETNEEVLNVQLQLEEQLKRLLFDTSDQVDDLSLRNQKLARQLAEAKDKREVQLAKIAASKSRQQLQARLESAQLVTWSLTQRLRSAETGLSSSQKMLPAKAQQKQLPAVRQTLPASSAQTALAVANRSIEHLNSENRRLSKEWMKAKELARQWEENFCRLAQRLEDVEDGNGEGRRIERQSQLQEQTENQRPGYFVRALKAIGMLGTGAVLGVGAVAMLGGEDSQKALGRAPEQKALGPKTQRLLPPKSNS